MNSISKVRLLLMVIKRILKRDAVSSNHNILKTLKNNINTFMTSIGLKKNISRYWGLGIGDWGLGIGPNPQSPIPNPQSPIPKIDKFLRNFIKISQGKLLNSYIISYIYFDI